MAWTLVAVAGMGCLVGAGFLFGGPELALLVAGVALILVAIDGRRAPEPPARPRPERQEFR